MHEFPHKVADFQKYIYLPNEFPSSILVVRMPGLVGGRGKRVFKK